jgi:hypothetical protein
MEIPFFKKKSKLEPPDDPQTPSRGKIVKVWSSPEPFSQPSGIQADADPPPPSDILAMIDSHISGVTSEKDPRSVRELIDAHNDKLTQEQRKALEAELNNMQKQAALLPGSGARESTLVGDGSKFCTNCSTRLTKEGHCVSCGNRTSRI